MESMDFSSDDDLDLSASPRRPAITRPLPLSAERSSQQEPRQRQFSGMSWMDNNNGTISRKFVSYKVMERNFLRQRDIMP